MPIGCRCRYNTLHHSVLFSIFPAFALLLRNPRLSKRADGGKAMVTTSLICIFHIRIDHKRSRFVTMVIETTFHDLSWFPSSQTTSRFIVTWNHDTSWNVSITIVIDRDLLWCILMWKYKWERLRASAYGGGFFFICPTDCRKSPCEKFTIQGINGRWPNTNYYHLSLFIVFVW